MSRKKWTARKNHPHLIAILTVLALLFGAGVATLGTATPAVASSCGDVLVQGKDWMGGAGVDVHSNGAYMNTGTGCANNDTEVYNLNATPPIYGFGWQCVELANRLYATKGWYSKLTIPSTYGGQSTNYGAKWLYTLAADGYYKGLTAHANGSGYVPIPGDMIVHSNGTYGHVTIVSAVNGNGTLTAVDQNRSSTGWETYSWNATTGTVSMSGATISGFVHADANNASSGGGSNPVYHNPASDFDGNRNADLSLTAKRSDGFADSRVWLSTGYQYLDAGVWRGLDGYGFDGITPLVADVNGDGYADYIFVTNEGINGVKVWVCLSTGSGLTTPQAWWNSAGYSYSNIKFNIGDLTGDGKAELVMTAKRSDGFADIRVLLSSGTSFQDAGVWRGLDGYGFDGITPLVADVTGDKKADVVFLTNEGANGIKAYAVASTGTGLGTPALWWTGTGYGYNGIKASTGDVDNNGASDLVLTAQRADGYADVLVLLSTWQGFMSPQKWLDLSGYGWSGIKPFSADTDGDAKADYIFVTNEGANGIKAYVAKSNASTLLSPSLFSSGGYSFSDIKVAVN